MKIINYRNITYAEVEKILRSLLDKGIKLDQLAIRVLEYVTKFNKCERAEELVKRLTALGLKEITAVMISNVVPQTIDELKSLMNFEGEMPSEDKLNEILSIVKELCAKTE